MSIKMFFKKMSLSTRVGVIVFIALFIFICLFGYLMILRESESILSQTLDLLEDVSLEAEKELSKNIGFIIEVENNQQLTQEQKIMTINQKLEPEFTHYAENEQELCIGYYSKELGVIAINMQRDDLPLGYKLDSNHPSTKLYTQGKIQREIGTVVRGQVVRYAKPVYWEGEPIGHIWTNIPYNNYLHKVYSTVPLFLALTALAMLLSIMVALFISLKIKKYMMIFSKNIEAFGNNPSDNLGLTNTMNSLPIEFHPLVRKYHSQVVQIRELIKELSISSRMAAFGDMIMTVSHDIRNPLAIIAMSAQMGKKKQDIVKNVEYFETIIKSSNLIEQILKKYLILAKNPNTKHERLFIDDIINDVLEIYDNLELTKGIKLNYYFEEDLPSIMGDEVSLKQVVINIISNAIQATPPGGRISINVSTKENSVLIDMANTGVAIPPEIQKEIFTKFFTKKDGGTGLGLAFVQKVVLEHRGKIWVESYPERTTFFIQLPIANDNNSTLLVNP
ncbi:MAG: hypothetical protein APF76_09240 [Desulfitibacter sp. BRH_c19]|nr:MAG: hypothetical protein APF76_09240 [Desulfitibacter sp. BRH_c19]